MTKTNPLRRYAHRSASGSRPCALVTGATGGMGEAYAHALSKLGFDLILHGRNPEKLAHVRAEILAEMSQSEPKQCSAPSSSSNSASGSGSGSGVVSETTVVHTFVADVSRLPPDFSGLCTLFAQEPSLHLTAVFNNVGITLPSFSLYEEVSEETITNLVIANTLFPSLVARETLRRLKDAGGPALMVNVSSLAAWAPSPYLSIYSGAKSFNLLFSHSLYNEMKAEGTLVDVVAVVPGQVVSGMNEGPPTSMMPTSADFVSSTLSSLAPSLFSQRPGPELIPWPGHAWGARFLSWAPTFLVDKATRDVNLDMRRKELEKKKKGGDARNEGQES